MECDMHLLSVTLALAVLLAPTSSEAQPLVVSRSGSRPVNSASAPNFTGRVRVEPLFEPLAPSDASGGTVTFEPGARTAWHSHPRGQILIVTEGIGRVQSWGGPIEEVRAGDVVRIPAGAKHWHGASPQSAMTHVAVTEQLAGSRVQWMEPVNDDQYNGPIAQPAAQRQAQPASAPPSSNRQPDAGRPSGQVQPRIAPGLATLTDDVLFGDVWQRPELSPRDRSLVTISVLIATGKSAVLAGHLGRALDNGVPPSEASGLLAHLAVYCGWPSAVSALDVYDQVYTARKIDTTTIRAASPRLPVPVWDTARAKAVGDELGTVAPKFVELTNGIVFGDVWRRSDLSLRDRSLVTIAALTAMGDVDQLDAYARRGIQSGLTRDQIAEAVTHVAFYAGWSKATKALAAMAGTLKD
jgi:4-carboxymuconolactone decarboxylase